MKIVKHIRRSNPIKERHIPPRYYAEVPEFKKKCYDTLFGNCPPKVIAKRLTYYYNHHMLDEDSRAGCFRELFGNKNATFIVSELNKTWIDPMYMIVCYEENDGMHRMGFIRFRAFKNPEYYDKTRRN